MTRAEIWKLVRIAGYVITMAWLVIILRADAAAGSSKFFESSITEHLQAALLLAAAIVCLVHSARSNMMQTVSFLLGGFFLMSFVREQDELLEHNIGTGAWQALVALILVSMTHRAWQYRDEIVSCLPGYIASFPFGLFISGFLVTFVFSRLVGDTELWQNIMGAAYERNVKNAVEESVELCGDAILLFSTIEYWFAWPIGHRATAAGPVSRSRS